MTLKADEDRWAAEKYEAIRDELLRHENNNGGAFRFTGDGNRLSFTFSDDEYGATVIWIDGPEFIIISETAPTKIVNLAPRGGMRTLYRKLMDNADHVSWKLIEAYAIEHGIERRAEAA